MTHFQRKLLIGGLAASMFPAALAAGDPQLTSLTVEGRIPVANVLPNPAAASMPPEFVEAIEAGSVEARLHIRYDAASNKLRVLGLAIPPKTPFPIPSIEQLPERSIGFDVDVAVERIYWSVTDKSQRTLYAVGRRTAVRKGPYPAGEYTVIQVVFDPEAPNKISMLIASMGTFISLTSQATGSVTVTTSQAQ